MFSLSNPKHLVVLLILVAAVGYGLVHMFYSMTPPQHADHDHAMQTLDAGGFLRVEKFGGGRRNLVGRPELVLVMHFCDPRSPNAMEAAQAARFAATVKEDPDVEVIFIARAESWDGLDSWAGTVGIPLEDLYLDKGAETSGRLGVRRWPETLIYAPDGTLAHQAMGGMDWTSTALTNRIAAARAGAGDGHDH